MRSLKGVKQNNFQLSAELREVL